MQKEHQAQPVMSQDYAGFTTYQSEGTFWPELADHLYLEYLAGADGTR